MRSILIFIDTQGWQKSKSALCSSCIDSENESDIEDDDLIEIKSALDRIISGITADQVM